MFHLFQTNTVLNGLTHCILSNMCTKCHPFIYPHAAMDLDLPYIIRSQSKVTAYTHYIQRHF